MDQPETRYAHFDQPAFEQMQIDHSISRVAIFFICFLTIGVFYFALVAFPVSRLLPIQQIQQLGNVLNPASSGSRTALESTKPTGALGGAVQSASAAPTASTGAAPSPVATAVSRAASAAPSSSARPSASGTASARGGSTYVVQPGDTLSAIARRYNTTVQAITSANKISETGSLQVGQRLTIR
ncbi:MAG: LysM peptidoglycan-binding domain-containing protein [Chloroflexota bacterium]|nr:LysM peptidoglycan-binding domain-containing protein [Chloroflexota bacterium]